MQVPSYCLKSSMTAQKPCLHSLVLFLFCQAGVIPALKIIPHVVVSNKTGVAHSVNRGAFFTVVAITPVAIFHADSCHGFILTHLGCG